MSLHRFSRILVGFLCAIPLALALPAQAEDESLGALVNNAILAMKQGNWEKGLELNNRAIDGYGTNAYLLVGPKFGTIHYRKGLCELKLKKWADAMQSFETCWKDFSNKDKAGGGNTFEKMALLKWGEAAVGAKDWELALTQFKKFLKEHDKNRDKFSQGAFYINLAICYYELGRIPEGNENLEIAIKNKARFPTPDSGIFAGFQSLVTAAILKANEQALLDFIAKNRADIVTDPYAMQPYARVLMKLAGEAVGAEMSRAAMALYQLVPSTDAAIDEVRARINSLGELPRLKDGRELLDKKKFQDDLAALETEKRGKQAAEMVKLAATAWLHEKHGNIRGAFAAYLQLESYYPNSEKREDNLYHLVRTSSLVSEGPVTQSFAESFVKSFPNSQHVPAVRRLMLSALFYDGEYQTCLEVAAPMIKLLEPGTPEHDICLHVLGGSYFYTAQYDKAQPLLDQHVKEYPESLFVIPSTYFQASNMSRLQFWSKAAKLLDAFLAKYPDPAKNSFLPFALYDRANCHYAEEQPEGALEKIARIVKDFRDSNVADQAFNLRGNVQQSLGNLEAAEKAYLAALEIAEKRRNPAVAGESLCSLVILLSDKINGKEENPRLKDSVPYADKFWKEYAEGSPYQTRLAVAQLPAFIAVDRGDEALERLQKVISEIAKNPQAIGLEELINSYTEAYLIKHAPEELKDHYYAFPGIRSTDRAARALLRVAVIGVFEEVAEKSDDEDRKRDASAMIKVLFQQLKTDFKLKDLTNFILVKLGDYLRLNTATPREALPYYDEALGRQNQAYRFPALLGRADVYGRSNNPAEIDKGIEDFTRVYEDSQEKPEREFSLYRIIELHMAKKDYVKAADQANIYLDRQTSGFSKYIPNVSMELAKSFEERGMTEDAMAMYSKVWSGNSMGNIKYSAPAIIRWMRIVWDRNKTSSGPGTPSDRQGAYEQGARYIEATGRFKDKMTASDLALWQEVEKLVQTYEADASIKSMEEIKREKEAARRR